MRALAVLAVALATTSLAWAAERCCEGAGPAADQDQGQAGAHARDRRSFSAWGGKRAGAGADLDDGFADGDDQKRAFSSWGGKRLAAGAGWPAPDDKRAKQSFYSWGGKRAEDEGDGDGAPQEKRAGVRFSSWGGKRDEAAAAEEQLAEGKRAFSSWGGKRFAEGDEKRAFSSWGESLANRRLDLYNYRPVQLRNGGNGPPFFPWGG